MYKTISKFLFCSIVLAQGVFASDQIPGAPQTKPILLRGGIIHTISGETLAPGAVLFDKGKIVAVDRTIDPPADAIIVELAGKHVYPGLIEPFSQVGLVEIDSVRATIDTSEIGNVNSNVRTQVAFNPDSEAIPVARANGVLFSLGVPSGGLIHGRSSLMQLDGWTWEDMAVKPNVGMHLSWPRFQAARPGRRGGRGAETGDPASAAQKQIDELKKWLDDARLYRDARADSAQGAPLDARLEGLQMVLRREIPLIVNADDTQQIQSAIAFCKKENIDLIIQGGAGAEECAPLLKEANVPVILSSVLRLPRAGHPYDDAYSLPARLQQAGVRFCIASSGQFGASTVRNLPYHAATAVAFGLTPDQAVRSITLSAAEILGVSDRIGSISSGKDATLFIADGDILEIPTLATAAYVQGRTVELTSHHTELYKKYSTKYDRIQGQ